MHRLLGRTYHAQRKTDEAVAAYRQAIDLDERDAWSMNNLGLLLLETRRADEALPLLTSAVELRKNVPEFHNNLGMALEHTGRFRAAATAYGEASPSIRATKRRSRTWRASKRSRADLKRRSPVNDAAGISRSSDEPLDSHRRHHCRRPALVPPLDAAAQGDRHAADKTLSPYFFVEGGDAAIDRLPLKDTRVDVAIAGVIADVTVRQVYENRGTRPHPRPLRLPRVDARGRLRDDDDRRQRPHGGHDQGA